MGKREIWLDWMRVIAILLVVLTHSTEPFYLGGEGSLILSRTDAFWVALINTFARACVPMFVIASAYLQFPIHYEPREFFKRRLTRVLVPFLVWTLVYALVWGKPSDNFRDLLLNFNYAAGHLWFVYMIIGIYLVMPLLSPWAEKVSRRELQAYLAIWLLSTLAPIVRNVMTGQDVPVIYGPGGIPMQAKYPLWGEASWNNYGVFYYFSGFIGYMLLGLYLKKYLADISAKRSIVAGLILFAAGFLFSGGGFLYNVFDTSQGVFPIGGRTGLATIWESTWCNDSLGVAAMATGWVLMLRNIKSDGSFYRKVIINCSKASYGVYLSHMLVLCYVSASIRDTFGTGDLALMGIWTTPVEILLSLAITYVVTNTAVILIQKIPGIGKYILG